RLKGLAFELERPPGRTSENGMINNIKTAVLLGGLGGLLILIGGFLGGPTGLVIGFGIGILIVGVSYWKSDVIAIKAAHARPVTEQEMPQYYVVVRELTQKAGMPMP